MVVSSQIQAVNTVAPNARFPRYHPRDAGLTEGLAAIVEIARALFPAALDRMAQVTPEPLAYASGGKPAGSLKPA